MKRLSPIFLLIITVLLSGCLGAKGPQFLTVELASGGPTAATREVFLSNDRGMSHLVTLDSGYSKTFALESGTWYLWGFARNTAGRVVAISPEITVRGGRNLTLQVPLQTTNLETAVVKPINLTHTWQKSGIQITWENQGLEKGTWQIWTRPSKGSLWRKIGAVEAWQTSFTSTLSNALDYVYGVRYVDSRSGILPGPLVVSTGLEPGTLRFTWEFRHERAWHTLTSAPLRPLGGITSFAAPFEPAQEFADLLAQFHSLEAYDRRYELLSALGLEIKDEIPLLWTALVAPGMKSERTLEEWSYYLGEEFSLEPNWIVRSQGVANLEANDWRLSFLRVPQAWDLTRGSTGITVAVLDTGLNQSLFGSRNVLTGYNSVNDTNLTHDDNADLHGTKVAGLLREVMPEVSIQPIKVLDSRGYGTDHMVIQGLFYAADLLGSARRNPNRADIINLSLGQPQHSEPLERAIQLVAREGILIVAASGNKNQHVWFPAAYPEVLAVGSVIPTSGDPQRVNDGSDDGSNFGPELDFVAPGGSRQYLINTIAGQGAGTSFATPQVTGIIGLMLASGIHPQEVKATLARTAVDLGLPGLDQEYGYGLVNAYWAVNNVDSFRILIKDRGSRELVGDLSAPLQGKDLAVPLPPGEYVVEGWLDLGRPGIHDAGDHYFSTIVELSDQGALPVHMILEEVR